MKYFQKLFAKHITSKSMWTLECVVASGKKSGLGKAFLTFISREMTGTWFDCNHHFYQYFCLQQERGAS